MTPPRAAIAAILLAAAAPAAAQTWRTLDSSRQLRDSSPVRVKVRYGVGRLDLRPTSEPVLYSMQLRYDEEQGPPVHRYDPEDHSLTLGVGRQSIHFGRRHHGESGEMRLLLTRAVPLALDVDLGASKARLDLGGLALQDVRVSAGASDARVDFGAPNPMRMRQLEFRAGAASFEVRRLGNANASTVRVKNGVGSVDLDFGGEWTQDVALDVNVALGKISIHVPRDVGVRMEVEKFLAAVDHAGLTKRGDAYYSENWDSAKYRLRLRAETAFGGIEIERTP